MVAAPHQVHAAGVWRPVLIFLGIMAVSFAYGAWKGLQALRAGLQGTKPPQRAPVVEFFSQRPSRGWRN